MANSYEIIDHEYDIVVVGVGAGVVFDIIFVLCSKLCSNC
jgi:hypothetical protein